MPKYLSVSSTSLTYTVTKDGKTYTNTLIWTQPPARVRQGETVTLTMSASTQDGPATVGGWFNLRNINPQTIQGVNGAGSYKGFRANSPHSGTVTFKANGAFRIEMSGGHDPAPDTWVVVAWDYTAAPAAPPERLSARIDCNPLTVVPNEPSKICHVIISGWRRDTANRVEVVFPKQSDGSGSQDSGGRTGIVVPTGQGSEAPHNMSGSRGPDGSYGKSYSWTLFVRARGNATPGTKMIPIIVRQQGAGQVRLALNVRVLPGRSGRAASTPAKSTASKPKLPSTNSSSRGKTTRKSSPTRTQPRTAQSKPRSGSTADNSNSSSGSENDSIQIVNQNAVLAKASELYDDGNWPAAEAEYRRVLRSNPNLDEAWDGLGSACFKQSKWKESEAAYRQAVRLNPNESWYHAQLANALLKQGRRDEAKKEAQEAVRLGLDDHEVFDELGLAGA